MAVAKKKPAAKAQKAPAKKAPVKKPVAKKAPAKKVMAKKPATRKAAVKTVKKAPAKTVKKAAAKKAVKKDRDTEKTYTNKQFVAKLRRLADSIEKGKNFTIQIDGERIYVPDRARFNVEHEREKKAHEIEFQIKWEDE